MQIRVLVLGPTLFLLYINDMPLSLSNWVADIFADDTTLSAHHHNSDDVISSLSSDLCNVDIWCSDNRMAINVTTSKLMLVSCKHNHSQLYSKHSNIPFHDSCIEVVTCKKLLCVYINSTLSWDEHINNVIKRCNKYLYLLSRIKCYLSIPSRKLFYNAYIIMPHFDYCCVIWGNCSAHLEDKLTKFPKRAARFGPFCILILWIKMDAFPRQGDISKSSTNVQNSPWRYTWMFKDIFHFNIWNSFKNTKIYMSFTIKFS